MLGHSPPPYDDSDEEGDEEAVAQLLQRPAFDAQREHLPPEPHLLPPTPPSRPAPSTPAQSSGAPKVPDQAILHAHLLDAQAELEQTRAIVGAARLRSVLRSKRALALGRAWAAWTHAALAGYHAARAEPLLRELTVLRAELADQRDRGEVLQQLREQVAAARTTDEVLQQEQSDAHSQLVGELTGAQAQLAAQRADLDEVRASEAALKAELGGAASTLREGFAEAAAQGARLAAEEHAKHLKQSKLSVLLLSGRAAALGAAIAQWAVVAASLYAARDRDKLRTSNGASAGLDPPFLWAVPSLLPSACLSCSPNGRRVETALCSPPRARDASDPPARRRPVVGAS